jgi:hypothetical protein
MQRTATLTAITHDGKDLYLLGRTAPIIKVREAFQKLKGLEWHEKYAVVVYQESDAVATERKFRTEAQWKEVQASHVEAKKKFDAHQENLRRKPKPLPSPQELFKVMHPEKPKK